MKMEARLLTLESENAKLMQEADGNQEKAGLFE
jgi:hypothetical protein